MNVIEVVRMLKARDADPVQVTIQNVGPPQLARRLAWQLDADSASSFAAALTSPEAAAEAGFDSVTLFSMFIPDTYEFYWTVAPEDSSGA